MSIQSKLKFLRDYYKSTISVDVSENSIEKDPFLIRKGIEILASGSNFEDTIDIALSKVKKELQQLINFTAKEKINYENMAKDTDYRLSHLYGLLGCIQKLELNDNCKDQ